MPEASPGFTIAYAVTSDGRHAFAGMARISILSVRLTNPGLRVTVVCDARSADALRGADHPLVRECDELISVETPPGDALFRNRWIKTSLRKYVDGDVLYLDADVLVRGELGELDGLVEEIGAVPNRNAAELKLQIWSEDRKVFESLGWPQGFESFVNGGFLFFRHTEKVREFFERWHAYWLTGITANGRLRDQPSLNSAILRSGVRLTVLPGIYNAQIATEGRRIEDAVIWHFYYSLEWHRGLLATLLNSARTESLDDLRLTVSRAMNSTEPWVSAGSSMVSP